MGIPIISSPIQVFTPCMCMGYKIADRLANIWGPGCFPHFLCFVGTVASDNADIELPSLPILNSQIKKNSSLVQSNPLKRVHSPIWVSIVTWSVSTVSSQPIPTITAHLTVSTRRTWCALQLGQHHSCILLYCWIFSCNISVMDE